MHPDGAENRTRGGRAPRFRVTGLCSQKNSEKLAENARSLASVTDPKAVNGKFPTILAGQLFTVGNNFQKIAISGLIFRKFDCEYPGVIIF
jgi:hypothetical protein